MRCSAVLCSGHLVSSVDCVQGFMEDLYSDPAVSSTVDFGQIKYGYWSSMNLHGPLNPKNRLPLTPEPFAPKVCAHVPACMHAYCMPAQS